MSIKKIVKNDNDFKKISLTQKFERLPGPQKAAVLAYIKGKEKPEYELDKLGKEFTENPIFGEMFAQHKKETPKRPMPGMKHSEKLALMSGLMQIVRKFVGDPDDDKALDLELTERVGGSQVSRETSPYDGKFAKAFKSEGARGIVKLHKNMMQNDIEYQTYLDGVE